MISDNGILPIDGQRGQSAKDIRTGMDYVRDGKVAEPCPLAITMYTMAR